MKVLWLTTDRIKRVANHFDDFRNAFSKVADVTTIYHPSFNTNPITLFNEYKNGARKYKHILPKELNYDIIICDALFLWMFESWDNVNIPVAIIIEDQHGDIPDIQIKFAVKHNFIIIHRYLFKKFHTDIPNDTKKIWSPMSVNTENFKDYGLPKRYGLLQTGAMYKVYKIRNMVYQATKNEKFYKRIERPKEYSKNQWPVQSDYSKELNKAWISLCCSANVNYPVMKFFEIPASRSVLYADWFDELGELGFVPDVNMIEVDTSNILGQLKEILNDKSYLYKIAMSGHELIHDAHTNDIRAGELLDNLRDTV